MADLASWFKRLTPLGGQGAEGAVTGAVDVLAEAAKAQAEAEKQIASADVAKQQKAKT